MWLNGSIKRFTSCLCAPASCRRRADWTALPSALNHSLLGLLQRLAVQLGQRLHARLVRAPPERDGGVVEHVLDHLRHRDGPRRRGVAAEVRVFHRRRGPVLELQLFAHANATMRAPFGVYPARRAREDRGNAGAVRPHAVRDDGRGYGGQAACSVRSGAKLRGHSGHVGFEATGGRLGVRSCSSTKSRVGGCSGSTTGSGAGSPPPDGGRGRAAGRATAGLPWAPSCARTSRAGWTSARTLTGPGSPDT